MTGRYNTTRKVTLAPAPDSNYPRHQRSRRGYSSLRTGIIITVLAGIGYITFFHPIEQKTYSGETYQGHHVNRADGEVELCFDPLSLEQRAGKEPALRLTSDSTRDSNGNPLNIGQEYDISTQVTLCNKLTGQKIVSSILPSR